MGSEAFILLLHKLGFHLPADVGKIYPRIPHFWAADHIYSIAAKLGNIDQDSLNFTLEEMERLAVPAMEEQEDIQVVRHNIQDIQHKDNPALSLDNMDDNFDSLDIEARTDQDEDTVKHVAMEMEEDYMFMI